MNSVLQCVERILISWHYYYSTFSRSYIDFCFFASQLHLQVSSVFCSHHYSYSIKSLSCLLQPQSFLDAMPFGIKKYSLKVCSFQISSTIVLRILNFCKLKLSAEATLEKVLLGKLCDSNWFKRRKSCCH